MGLCGQGHLTFSLSNLNTFRAVFHVTQKHERGGVDWDSLFSVGREFSLQVMEVPR